ncbi:hypothetical protein [Brevibacterium casei]|uniref:hypothetical protein n=1 Tax=Brevibacterium casei TaxID=33889 RepID=UPI00103F553B
MKLTQSERRQLAATLNCADGQLDDHLQSFSDAATEEYVRMILGQRIFTRGQDILEYRLFLLVRHVFDGTLPTTSQISAYFQTTAAQSRALLRAVLSKYQYELQEAVKKTVKRQLSEATDDPNSDSMIITVNSENVVEELNRQLADIDGNLPQITKVRGTISSYSIKPSAFEELRNRVDLNDTEEVDA